MKRWLWKAACLALVALGAGAHAQQPDMNAPTLVVLYDRILAMNDGSEVAQAVAIRDRKVLAVGDNAAIRSMAGTTTCTVDLGGKTVVAELIDTYTHFKAAGLADCVVNMSRAKTVAEATLTEATLAEALEAIKQSAAKKKPSDWIVAGARHPPSQLAEKRYVRA